MHIMFFIYKNSDAILAKEAEQLSIMTHDSSL
jgi:hypothetical protein